MPDFIDFISNIWQCYFFFFTKTIMNIVWKFTDFSLKDVYILLFHLKYDIFHMIFLHSFFQIEMLFSCFWTTGGYSADI